ncbi:MAG: hypothetical protein ACRENK_16370 [Gemmatimonadaceae bacterium]
MPTPRARLMCHAHWSLLPPRVRIAVLDHIGPMAEQSAAWFVVEFTALAIVALAEGKAERAREYVGRVVDWQQTKERGHQ